MHPTAVAPNAGHRLYHAVWQMARDHFYDPERLNNWHDWQHCFDDQISCLAEGEDHARLLLTKLADRYTKLITGDQAESERYEAAGACGVSARLIEGGFSYIRIPSFSAKSVFEELRAALESIQSCHGLIIDLRGNNGGLMDDAARCIEFFVEEGAIATVETKSANGFEKNETYLIAYASIRMTTYPDGRTEDRFSERAPCMVGEKPIVILIDGETASAAEMFAAALLENDKQDNRIAIGGRTLGKGIIQARFGFASCAIKLSCGRFLSPSEKWFGDGGQSVSNGIEPAICVEPSGSLDEMDAALQAAVGHLRTA